MSKSNFGQWSEQMAIFHVSTEQDKIKDSTGGNYITKSGIYDVTLKHVLYSQSPNGSTSIDLNFDYNGQNQTIWSAIRLTNNDGKENFDANNFNKLCIIAGLQDGQEIPDPVPVQLPIGKNQEMRDCLELEYFKDINVGMRVQLEYRRYNDDIIENKRIKNFFRFPDNATASEIVNDAKLGNQYEEEQKIADKITYRDEITPEEVTEWKKNKRSGNSNEEGKSDSFSKRRTFGKVQPTPF